MELKRHRTQQSKSLSKPAHTILSNASLQMICDTNVGALPANDKELLKIKGIGPKKLEMYGGRMLTIIARYRDQEIEMMENVDMDDVISMSDNANFENEQGIGIVSEYGSGSGSEQGEAEGSNPNNVQSGSPTVDIAQLKETLREYRIQQSQPIKKPAYTIFTNTMRH